MTCISWAGTSEPSTVPWVSVMLAKSARDGSECAVTHGGRGNVFLIQQECGSIHRVYSKVIFEVQP